MSAIIKDYPGVRALKGVDLHVSNSEILGIVGANGAGKSTVVRILAGMCSDYSGSIEINGVPTCLHSPQVAIGSGIAVCPQEPALAWNLSVADNLCLGGDASRGIPDLLKKRTVTAEHRQFLEVFGVDFSQLYCAAASLTRREMQLIQLTKAFASNPRILVLDEPTTALTGPDIERVFKAVRQFASRGVPAIFISHTIEHVVDLCDRVSVLRDGSKVADVESAKTNRDLLMLAMFGTEVHHNVGRPSELGQVILAVENLKTNACPPVSLETRAGEIVGVVGKIGAARGLLRAIFGVLPRISGSIRILGFEEIIHSPEDAIRAGIGFLPEDRLREGLFPDLTVLINITLLALRRLLRAWLVRWPRVRDLARERIADLHISAPLLDAEIRVLSGGNQQKALFARWISTRTRVLLLEDPTTGMDVSAKHEVYRILQMLRARRVAVLIASSDADTLLSLCDRIVVLGRDIAHSIPVDAGTRPILLAAMTDAEAA